MIGDLRRNCKANLLGPFEEFYGQQVDASPDGVGGEAVQMQAFWETHIGVVDEAGVHQVQVLQACRDRKNYETLSREGSSSVVLSLM